MLGSERLSVALAGRKAYPTIHTGVVASGLRWNEEKMKLG